MRFSDKIKNTLNSNKTDDNESQNVFDGSLDDMSKNSLVSVSTFGDLDNLIHRGINLIVLDSDICGEGIEIDLNVDNIVIDGNGHIIDAQGKSRIFNVSGKNVTLKNIIFKNGLSDEKGGAIYNGSGGLLQIFDCTFEKNGLKGKYPEGGAIFNEYTSKLLVKDCFFIKNSVDGEYDDYGSAICNKGFINGLDVIREKGKCEIINCTFEANLTKHPEFGAGAILNEGEMKIEGCTLKGNKSTAIYNRVEIEISDCIFKGNSVSKVNGSGGAILNEGKMNLNSSKFIRNNASKGGVISCDFSLTKINKVVRINDCIFEQNTFESSLIYNFNDTTIKNSKIINNSFSEGFLIENKKKLNIFNVTFQDNASKKEFIKNGSSRSNVGEIKIRDSIFENNSSGMDFLANISGDMKIINTEFVYNKCPNFILNNDSLNIFGSDFKDNESANMIINDELSTLGIFSGIFSNNALKKHVIFNNGKNCTIDNTFFENNSFSEETFYNLYNLSYLTLISPKITDDGKSIFNNGHILIKKSSKDLEEKIYNLSSIEYPPKFKDDEDENMSNFTYLDEIIHESDGEIVLDRDIVLKDYEIEFYEGGIELDIEDLVIDGGGHVIDGANQSRIFIVTGKNITLKNIKFKNGFSYKNYDNPLNCDGGAIHNKCENTLIVEGCEFSNNASEENGGAILNGKDCTVKLINSVLLQNTAQQGGAIDNWGNLHIFESIFSNNCSKQYGGVIKSNKNSILKISESKFENNVANGDGGVIFNNGELSICNSIFNDNAVCDDFKRGGAIYNGGGSFEIKACKLSNNHAGYGGAIYNSKGKSSISFSIFEGCESKVAGGAILHRGEDSMKISGCEFIKNRANSGGAIYNQMVLQNSHYLEISISLFLNNLASRGGAIFCDGEVPDRGLTASLSTTFIKDSEFFDNDAETGQTIYKNHIAQLKVTNCKFSGGRDTLYATPDYKTYRFDVSSNCEFDYNGSNGS